MSLFLLPVSQLPLIASEINNDPKQLQYASYLEIEDWNSIFTMLTCPRDGITPCPVNGAGSITGPTGTIASTTGAAPVVVTTSAPHGLANGDSVFISGNTQTAANGYFTIAGVTSTTFQIQTPGNLNNIVGTGAGTGGTWAFCVSGVRQQNVTISSVWAAMAKGDLVAATATLTGLQQTELAVAVGLLNNPSGNVQFTTTAGADTNELAFIKSMFAAGTGSVTNLTALKYRNGSRAEQILGISNPIIYLDNTGIAPTVDDIAAAMGFPPP